MNLSREEIEKRVRDSYEIENNVLNAVPEPIVTVKTATYQHAPYIRDCIEGVLMQQTSFPFEYIIGEDFSTDGTREIVFEYAKKHPELIRVITADYNVGIKANSFRRYQATRGKYIALCEGDDYWTDPHKLQKQVDFLEENPDFSMCSHAVKTIYENDWKGRKTNRFRKPIQVATFEDILDYHFIPTNSLMFRNGIIKAWPDWLFSKCMISGDILLELMLASHGKSYYMKEEMATKRINGGGITANEAFKENAAYCGFERYYYLNNYTQNKYKDLLVSKMVRKLPGVVKKSLKRGKILLAIKHILYLLRAILK